MAFKQVQGFDCDTQVALGGINKKTGKPNPKSIQGYFLGSKDTPNKLAKTGTSKLHIFQTAKGNVGIWGKTNLDMKLNGVTPGVMTRVTQDGKRPTNKGNDMLLFVVEVDEDNTIEVASMSVSQDSDESIQDDARQYHSDEHDQNDNYGDDSEESEDLEAEEAPMDEVKPTRAMPPRGRVTNTSVANRKARTEALLGSKN